MRRRLAPGLTAAVVLGALLWSSSTVTAALAAPPATLHVAIPGAFAGCDPGSPTTTPSTDAVLSLVLPSAFTTGPTATAMGNTFVISQAEVVSLNPQTVIYTIAPGITWPDGTSLTAADLVRTWQQRRADRVVADLGYRDVASVHPNAAGNSVTVGFTTAYSDWESLFNLMVPGATTRATCTLPTAALDPSIGPYAIHDASASRITLTANPAWTGTPAAYATVVVSTDPSAVPTRAGGPRAAFLEGPTVAQLDAITSTGAYESVLGHSTTIVSLDFAVHGASSLPLTVRSAVAHLIDRDAIIADEFAPVDYTTSPGASHLLGQGQAGYLGAPGVPLAKAAIAPAPVPGSTGADAYGSVADVVDANEALRAAGYSKSSTGWRTPSLEPFSVCLAVPAFDATLRAVAGALSSQLLREGVLVDTRYEPSPAATVSALRNGTCAGALMLRTGDGFPTHEAASWLAPSSPVPADLTWSGVHDEIATSNAVAATELLNPIEAQPSWNAMDARLWDLMVGLPIYTPSIYEAWTPSIAGVTPSTTVAGFVDEIPTLLPSSSKS